MLPKHLTPEELCERWSVKAKTLSQWRWSGKGPKFLKAGGRVMYRVCDIEKYEEEQVFTNTSQHTQKLSTTLRSQLYA